MKQLLCLSVSVLALSACVQDNAAPIEQRGDRFYGRDGTFDERGHELPKYSDRHRAVLPDDEAEKYSDDGQHRYGVSAELAPISSAELPSIEQELAAVQAADEAAAQAAMNAANEANIASEDVGQSLLPFNWGAQTPEVVEPVKPIPQTVKPAGTPSFVAPLRGKLLGRNVHGKQGVLIAGRKGEPVRAASGGVIVHAGDDIKSFGNTVIIRHADGYVTTYAHLADMVVSKGDDVVEGELIGFVGKTGAVDTPQLFFSAQQGSKEIDAASLLRLQK